MLGNSQNLRTVDSEVHTASVQREGEETVTFHIRGSSRHYQQLLCHLSPALDPTENAHKANSASYHVDKDKHQERGHSPGWCPRCDPHLIPSFACRLAEL